MKKILLLLIVSLILFNSCKKEDSNPFTPSSPTVPTLSSPSDGASNVAFPIALTWNAFSGATSYTLQVSVDTSFTSYVYNQSGLTSTTQQMSGFSDSTTYYWRVSSNNSSGLSNTWSFSTAAAGGSVPDRPTLLSPINLSTNQSTSPTLSWNLSCGATGYTLQVSKTSSYSSLIYNQGGITGTNYQLTGLDDSTMYYWRVSASNKNGTSANSASWLFATAGTGIPASPFQASPINGALDVTLPVILTWNASFGATSYTLQVSDNSTFTTVLLNNNSSTTSREVTNLNYSTTYYWRVSATNTFGTSNPSSTWSFTTNDGKPAVPTLLSPNDGAVNEPISPTLSWNSSSGATSYTLQVSENNLFTSFVYNQSGLTYTSQQMINLNYSTTYYWRVSATNTFGTSSFSNTWSFSTNDGRPGVPTLLSPSDGAAKQSTSPTLKWNASSGATGYTLQVSVSNLFTSYVYNQSGLTSTSQQVIGLNNSATYYWRVSASNSYGTSNSSNPWSFTTFGGSSCVGTQTVTYSGKTYNTVQIGNQCWLKENLDVGTMINSTSAGGFQQTNNGVVEKYCYDNNLANCNTYGGLYEWTEAMQYVTTPGTKGICPPGWHIPTSPELEALKAAVNNDGNALKAIGQGTGGGQGTNTSGFSALLAGRRNTHLGYFDTLGYYARFWSSTEYISNDAYYLFLVQDGSSISLNNYGKDFGFSVRCVKDN